MYFLGFDIGSSSVKASLLDGESGKVIASALSPEKEMEITAPQPGWAEQDPGLWWQNVKLATTKILASSFIDKANIKAIGIAYQMHGLVLVDKSQQVLRPAIIWCDSRAVETGAKAFKELGEKNCLESFLNSPGNFTASKLKWVKENEPDIYSKINKFMLPGDYIAMKMSGQIQTTISGLSEGILWDYKEQTVADSLLEYYGIDKALVPDVVLNFSEQASLSENAAKELGLTVGTKITYRAGDQPNNAFSLNVLQPGEVATTAGTSGVIYGVTDKAKYDSRSRVNPFVHVNHSTNSNRYGVLLCINGTGSLNSWLRKFISTGSDVSYEQMNLLASQSPIGSQDLLFYPFGNGAERIFENRNIGGSLHNFQFNTHHTAHVLRAGQEGIVFALNYGLEIMKEMGIQTKVVRAGKTNMFLSPLFCNAFASLTGATVELYNTDGAQGAARGAAVGFGYYNNFSEAFVGLEKRTTIEPDQKIVAQYQEAYQLWLNHLNKILTVL